MDLMNLAGVTVTAAITVATHMAARVFHAPNGNSLWRVARYTLGCVAILAGLLFMLEWETWLTVAAVVAVAGIVTIVCYVVVELFNYHNRAHAAEQATDADHDLL